MTAYANFNVAVQEGLPATDTLQRIQELSTGDRAAGRQFLRDLGHVVGTLDEFRKAVQEQVVLLDSNPSPKIRLLPHKAQGVGAAAQKQNLTGAQRRGDGGSKR